MVYRKAKPNSQDEGMKAESQTARVDNLKPHEETVKSAPGGPCRTYAELKKLKQELAEEKRQRELRDGVKG
jgi:hypothetical protein